MKLSYRQAVELTGLGGAVYRGRILNKIVAGFYGQAEMKAESFKVVSLGLFYIIVVGALFVALNLSFGFLIFGLLAGVIFISFALPSKGFVLYQADKVDEPFDVD